MHPFVAAYGQRRGYTMSDLDGVLSQNSTLFSSNSNLTNHRSPSINFTLAADLTLNISDPTAYSNELTFFASFYNSLPVAVRRQLRSYADGIFSYFTEKLCRFGYSAEILSPSLVEFQFPDADGQVTVENGSDAVSDINQLLKTFLKEFRTPLINEYLRSKNDLVSSNSVDQKGGNGISGGPMVKMESEDEAVSENEDPDVEDPVWWKKDVQLAVEEEIEPKEDVNPELAAILDQIRIASSKMASEEPADESVVFPYSVKFYNFSSNQENENRSRNVPRSSAVCADITSDGRMACFGCDNDSSIRCLSLRRFKSPNTMSSRSSFTLHGSSASGIIYRVGTLDDPVSGGSYLLVTSDDLSRPIQLFDLMSPSKIYDYRGHGWPVWALDVAHRAGGIFVTGSYDRTARLFLVDRKDPVRVLVGHESSVDCVRFIQDRQDEREASYPSFMATASSDGTVRIWSIKDAIGVRVFHGMKGSPTALAYRSMSNSINEKLLACATTEGKIFIWEFETGRTYQILEGVLVNDMEFSPDGQFLVAGGDGGCFKIYRLSTEGGGEFGSQYVELQISDNQFFHNMDAKFLKAKFLTKDLICLAA